MKTNSSPLAQQPIPTNGRHWHYLYQRRRRRVLGISGRHVALTQIISLAGSILAGVHLEEHKHILAMAIGAFIILPGVLDLGSSLGATLSAKINHKLEDPKANVFLVYLRNVGDAMLIAGLGGLIVASIGAGIAVAFGGQFMQIFLLAMGSILLSAVIGFPIIGLLSVIFRHFKINPDDVVGPIESSFFDILTVVTLTIVIGWLT